MCRESISQGPENTVFQLIEEERRRQNETLSLIPSENHPSLEVKLAIGSIFIDKYAEGYPGRRYYQGNKNVDRLEKFAKEKAEKLFGVVHVNVQPYSGSPANAAILFALAESEDTIMGLELSAGGHLTHGHPDITFSGKCFRSVQFGLDEKGLLDYDEIEEIARKEKPKVMMIGTTAYPLAFDWKKFGEIADKVGAYLVADISHVSGLIIGGVYPDPVPYSHLVMTTTHKTLRGPRGAMIMVTEKGEKKDSGLVKKIDRAVFPGLQGGPHMHTIAGIAQALIEADTLEFRTYAKQIVKNAKALANNLKDKDLTLVAGGTESHLMVVDLRPLGLSGNVVAEALEVAGLVANRNSVPNDEMPPFYPSGVRLGTPAATTRGMKEAQMKTISDWIIKVIKHVANEKLPNDREKRRVFMREFKLRVRRDPFLQEISKEVREFLKKYPVP